VRDASSAFLVGLVELRVQAVAQVDTGLTDCYAARLSQRCPHSGPRMLSEFQLGVLRATRRRRGCY
jgi:hypothetical protein